MILVAVFVALAGFGAYHAEDTSLRYPHAVRQRMVNLLTAEGGMSNERVECIISVAEKYIPPAAIEGAIQGDPSTFAAAAKEIMNTCPKD